MTKDWDAVKAEIEELSWVKKMRLDEVRRIMEREHGFKASTRAYRMKLSEWGYTTRKTAKPRGTKRKRGEDGEEEVESDSEGSDTGAPRECERTRDVEETPQDSTTLESVLLGRANIRAMSVEDDEVDRRRLALQGAEDLLPVVAFEDAPPTTAEMDVAPGINEGVGLNGIVMTMLDAILEGDSQKLEPLAMQHPEYLNLPLGQPFDIPGSKFYNHPVMSTCVILQHPGQTLLDIASAIPTGAALWILLAYGGSGSTHPLGTDLALHNAIKNGRTYAVQALLMPNRSKVHGEPGTMWKPILQAVYWNHPQIVRMLIDKGANVNETSPWVDGTLKNVLLHCTERRQRDFLNPEVKENCNKILKLLLNAGADIHVKPGGEGSPTVFDTFLRPWQGDPHWISKLSADEMECLEGFIRKGADLKTTFMGFTCGAHSYNQFQHQMLWHTTTAAARLLVDHAAPIPEGNGSTLLHEIVGSCPDAKRHPSDTLRDIEVLLSRGADPNLLDDSLFTPLRRCIEKCPAVDLIPRLRLLLDGGADPELKHSNRLPPYVLAARTFDEPLRAQVLDFLVAKLNGRQSRVVYDDTYTWTPGYFPIPASPSWDQVQAYTPQDGVFAANLERMVPEDVREVFQRACFSVASMNFLNTATTQVKRMHPLPPTVAQKDEIYRAVAQRGECGLPVFTFDQEFVMILLKPDMAPALPTLTLPTFPSHRLAVEDEGFMLPHQTPIASSAQDEPSVLATTSTFRFNPTPLPAPATPSSSYPAPTHTISASRPANEASPPLNSDTDFSMPETTLIRWHLTGSPTRASDVKKAKESVLRYRCEDCGGGTLLTSKELERHVVEHEHSGLCVEEGCKRRFCAKRGGAWSRGVKVVV
ncbi:ankyrin [Bimuria novae-zelandiae CBS 107.79]|uniref:Ankyrin n=1 Tax=Bimuria novae-zelandiae CBS 107.79 TaxID=1447943 RepID=A0A6A5UUG8_9PLEO|nr:ankyrin [Bimuria novae-zelandiae CBS 107.79]